mgnify:CR=1 FL=1
MLYIAVPLFILPFVGYIFFYSLTKKREFVKVIKKFQVNGIYKIVDDKNTEYLITDNVIVSEKKCKEMWEKIKEDELNYITFYGISYSLFDWKYNIIDVN